MNTSEFKKTVLIVVPHGDDEALMCGGSISRFVREGHTVHVAFVRGAHDPRTYNQLSDTKASRAILGIHEIHYLHLTEEVVSNDFLTLKQKIEYIISEIKPNIVITTFYGDNHQDHKNTFRAVSVACRVHSAPFIEQILVGEINSSTDQDISADVFAPNYFIKLEESDIIKKCKAMEAYQAERREAPHPRSALNIRAQAMTRGMVVGIKYAEAFMCLRSIN